MYKLILADDEHMVVEGIVNSIDWSSYNIEVVGTASDGAELINLAKNHHPDIVFTDIRMPCMDGLEAARQLKNLDKNMQLVIITAYEEFEYAKKAIQYGATSLISKNSFSL